MSPKFIKSRNQIKAETKSFSWFSHNNEFWSESLAEKQNVEDEQ